MSGCKVICEYICLDTNWFGGEQRAAPYISIRFVGEELIMYSGHAGAVTQWSTTWSKSAEIIRQSLKWSFLEISLKPWHLEESDSNNERGDKLALVRRGGTKKSSNSSKKGLEFAEIIGYQVTVSASIKEDSICASQNLSPWFFVMRPKPPIFRHKETENKILLFRQNKLCGLNMTRWHGAPARTRRFMRQLSFISVFSKKKKRLLDVDS